MIISRRKKRAKGSVPLALLGSISGDFPVKYKNEACDSLNKGEVFRLWQAKYPIFMFFESVGGNSPSI
jgi:hypothetical protein